MSYHHYYDKDFLRHLSQVNPELSAKLSEQHRVFVEERDRLWRDYCDSLQAALKENLEALKPHLRPCHRRDVDEGGELRVSPTPY